MLQEVRALKDIAKRRRMRREPDRVQYVMKQLRERGFSPEWIETERAVKFERNGHIITVFPYKGWFSGKGLVSGRGIDKLLAQIDK